MRARVLWTVLLVLVAAGALLGARYVNDQHQQCVRATSAFVLDSTGRAIGTQQRCLEYGVP